MTFCAQDRLPSRLAQATRKTSNNSHLMIHALVLAAAGASNNAKPLRTLVYSFTYSTPLEQNKGTVQADVLGITADGGLVVRFAQQVAGKPAETMAPAECAVYANTQIQCKTANALGMFENELGHLLGRKFVNGDVMDDKSHWRIAGGMGSGNVIDDFTVTHNTAGIATIQEVRDFTVSGTTTHHVAQFTYDLNKTIPTNLKYTDSTVGAAPGHEMTVEYTLVSDSFDTKK
jgi:hypothetical protein